MLRRPPRPTRTDPLFPDPTLFLSGPALWRTEAQSAAPPTPTARVREPRERRRTGDSPAPPLTRRPDSAGDRARTTAAVGRPRGRLGRRDRKSTRLNSSH